MEIDQNELLEAIKAGRDMSAEQLAIFQEYLVEAQKLIAAKAEDELKRLTTILTQYPPDQLMDIAHKLLDQAIEDEPLSWEKGTITNEYREETKKG